MQLRGKKHQYIHIFNVTLAMRSVKNIHMAGVPLSHISGEAPNPMLQRLWH